jgi:hypothetical protein
MTTKYFKINSGQHQTLNNSGLRETERESNEAVSAEFLNKYEVRGLLKWDCWCPADKAYLPHPTTESCRPLAQTSPLTHFSCNR